MKKILLVAGIALLSLTANAQEKAKSGLQGAWFATAQVGYNQVKIGDVKTTQTTILPVVGTFVSPSVAVGAAFGSIGLKKESGSVTNANYQLVAVEPLIRKYYNVAGGLFFFGQGSIPVITGKEKISGTKVTQFGLAGSAGFDYFVTKSLSVEFSYNLINISQETDKLGDSKTTTTDVSIAHVASTPLDGSTLTSPLSFGFKFIF